MLTNAISNDARKTINEVKDNLIPSLRDLWIYVSDCVEHYEDGLDQREAKDHWGSYAEKDAFIKDNTAVLNELLQECSASYNKALDKLNQLSIDFTGVDITE